MYIVEGNIGAGKSTFLKLIQQYLPHVSVALEPLHDWQKQVYGQSLLANFYQNPKRWAYTIETLTMMCRVKEHRREQQYPNQNRMMERSIYSGHYCFAHNGYEHQFMTDIEWKIYNNWFDFLIPGKCKAPLGFIYLRVEPEVAYERIKKRNRLTEKELTLAYVKQIHEKHEQFLVEKKSLIPDIKNAPVLTLDCNQEFETDEAQLKRHFVKLEEFLMSTQATYKPAQLDSLPL